MKLEAYLGPNSPETLATGEVNSRIAPFANYGVVKFLRQGNQKVGSWVGAYTSYATAVAVVDRHTTVLHYAILCSLRPARSEVTQEVGPLNLESVQDLQDDEQWLASQNTKEEAQA